MIRNIESGEVNAWIFEDESMEDNKSKNDVADENISSRSMESGGTGQQNNQECNKVPFCL